MFIHITASIASDPSLLIYNFYLCGVTIVYSFATVCFDRLCLNNINTNKREWHNLADKISLNDY